VSNLLESRSVYEIGLDGSPEGSASNTRRGSRSGRIAPTNAEVFDFESCEIVSETALRHALMTRSSVALDYIADVVPDLATHAEVCSHVINTLPRAPNAITFLTEIKRRCLIKNVYTHSIFMQAAFLHGSVRVRVKDSTEKGAKQAAHIAFVKQLCERVLAGDEFQTPGKSPVQHPIEQSCPTAFI
jgi:hypothetical protein